MESTISPREFFVVQYPGIVKNDERAIETLGGLQSLNKSFNSLTRRLRLSFRPEMLFSKPVYGDPHSKTALIICAKQLKNRRTGEVKFVSEVVGVASRVYTFNAMFDFQYGPFEKIPANSNKVVSDCAPPSHCFRVFYDRLLVKEPTRVLDSHLRAPDIPLFLPPLLFTRLDQPTMYCFSSRFRMNEYVELENNSQQHPYHRKERKSYAMFVNFGDPIPSVAHPGALQAITSLGPHTRKLAHDVEKLFRRRPIWGKASLVHSLNWKRVRECAIKTILPAYAYYMPNGPWGRVWVRFGYDPCKDPSSRMYQTVDYRVRSPRLQAKLCISGRRPRADDREDTDPSGSDVDEARDTSTIDATLAAMRSGESSLPVHASSKSTSAFRFSKTSWPDARQILYQLVDIDVPEVVEMLAAPMCRTVCDPNYGWMPADYQKTIREIMTRYLETWVLGNATFSKTA
ncbi:locus tagral transcription factor 3C polypeptide 5 [Echinococcus multilocularis]|uniref:Locus tagral transcription factor 3C polypeptide 5 n=1 Tax=Echinococcus multilocularis TaxID=6211 RepID=A0A068Y0V7_ECHMU|nr:locus tagral transcription factor 3C polypeptide 5 [Echinococcus multilocularis]